ncbi:efflux RND transporter periplasmic adaptor subunit [Pseudomonas agarici]|uniref:efflux RND transporter periplasmic adaptor subunit n=1 Tax=Pseudomonas agarici TaxID=46677 RepID=UPI0015A38C75|nr:efflux RND transporter periplasmic adaptor subunit [Pseudomonas agarici]NWB90497.1 efflux RND transporter periplasmic adaptor subunit [Pseudomonas agarici]
MHIQKKNLLGLVVILLVAAGVTWKLTRPAHVKPASNLAIPVKVVHVTQRDVPRYARGIGTVLSLHSVVIRPQIDGILTRVLVKEGQLVKTGDLLATLDDRSIQANLAQAKAMLAQSQAQLQVAQVDLQRYKLLSVDNGISKQTYDQQQALVNQLQATAQGNQAAIAAAQVQLSYTQIHSPVTGRVGIRAVDEGNFLRMNDALGLFSVTQIDPIAVEFSLPQQMLPTLQRLLGAAKPASVDAYLGDDGHASTLLGAGHLTLIDNQVAATTGTIKAKAEFSNPTQTLWPGQLVNIKIQTALERDALVVPPTVVQRGMDGYIVYRVKDQGVEVVPVQVPYQDSELNIIEGVEAGDLLVSDGQSRLKPNSQVAILDKPKLVEQTVAVEPKP